MTEELLRSVLAGYPLPWDGIHGLTHWGRVMENGRRLAELTGADVRVVELFALFHDCRRINEGTDPGHGLRGAELARTLYQAGTLELSGVQLVQLHWACERHTDGLLSADATVETCWDADRLDLGRVRITPDPRYLCTAAAKEPALIEWAEKRSRIDHCTPEVDRWLAGAAAGAAQER